MSTRTVVIVGGGVTGLSTAYHLARRRYGRIVVLEKDTLGGGSSSRAAGITTGLLWSETGVLARRTALALFGELSRELPGYTFHREHGCLNLFTPSSWPDREKLLPLYDRLGAPYRVLTAGEIRQRWPRLHPPMDFVGLHDPLGGYSEPPEYLSALAQRVRELGVEVRENTVVTDFLRSGAAVTGVRAGGETIPADAVVATVYAWTPPTLAALGLRLPAKTFVHQRYVTAPLPVPLDIPAVNADPLGGYVRPAAGNRLLLGVETAEREEWRVQSTAFRTDELSPPAGLREQTLERFRSFLPGIEQMSWESQKVGLISFSMDGEPILGPVRATPGLFVGLAFHSGGFSYNPVAGLLLAEFVSEGKTSIDVTAFSPDRFAAGPTDEYLTATVKQRDAVRRRH